MYMHTRYMTRAHTHTNTHSRPRAHARTLHHSASFVTDSPDVYDDQCVPGSIVHWVQLNSWFTVWRGGVVVACVGSHQSSVSHVALRCAPGAHTCIHACMCLYTTERYPYMYVYIQARTRMHMRTWTYTTATKGTTGTGAEKGQRGEGGRREEMRGGA